MGRSLPILERVCASLCKRITATLMKYRSRIDAMGDSLKLLAEKLCECFRGRLGRAFAKTNL